MKSGEKFGGTLKVAAQASLETLDTSFSGAYVVTTISAHVWERLFERDAGFNAKPQMVGLGYGEKLLDIPQVNQSVKVVELRFEVLIC